MMSELLVGKEVGLQQHWMGEEVGVVSLLQQADLSLRCLLYTSDAADE